MATTKRKRAEAYTGEGYGLQRYELFCHARQHIISCMKNGFYLEAITIIESIIADRIESRVSHLKGQNYGFKTLGNLIPEAKKLDSDPEILAILDHIDKWREDRNKCLHEMVKIEEGTNLTWDERTGRNRDIAISGYRVLVEIYQRVADLNPYHPDRVFSEIDWAKLD
jgi:hypothetical protein